MARSHFFSAAFAVIASLAIAAVAPIVYAATAVRDFFVSALDFIAAGNPPLALEGWDGLDPMAGHPLDRATQQFIRHESNYDKRGAARNI
jgi:hypothetical protein